MSNNIDQCDYVVFIGRFEPLHNGHLQVIKTALGVAKKVILCLGSAFAPRTIKNPWTMNERVHMIKSSLPHDCIDRVIITGVGDNLYSDQKWAASVQNAVNLVVGSGGWTDKPPTVALIGHKKDSSSYYLDMFPQWSLIEHEMSEIVSATDIRTLYFEKDISYIKAVVPTPVFDFLSTFRTTMQYRTLLQEHVFIKKYIASWNAAPYKPTFVTADAVVVQSGHVLLVVRKASPGAGLLALPGGFVNQNERVQDAAIRELKEETRIKVPAPVLIGNIKRSNVFDHPERSLRGRTITHAFMIELPPGDLPKVKGGDDASSAMWVPLNAVREQDMFEDHYAIIQYMVGV